jgi:hypothetical protein
MSPARPSPYVLKRAQDIRFEVYRMGGIDALHPIMPPKQGPGTKKGSR